MEVQLEAAEAWRPATLNLPLSEGTRIRTGPGARLEIELDDAGVLRMVDEGLAELSDYSRLSGGQRITVISLDHGLAYFTGEPSEGSSIHLLVPGAQATLRQGSRIRLQAHAESSEFAILEGAARFTIPSADMELRQGQTARVTVPSSSHFSLYREVVPVESDSWSEQRDKAEAQAPASRLALDQGGKWIRTGDYGTVWQPAPQAGWAPFRQGRWIWFQSIGYTWAGSEPWGWKPYHEGRWLQHPDLGWVWLPGAQSSGEFLPGAVYWARSTTLVAWGPLAPDELWTGAGPPRQFAALNTTSGLFFSGVREISPSPAEDMPQDLLKVFQFTAALPSPPLPVSRLTLAREPLRTRLFSAVQVEPEVQMAPEAAPPPPDAEPVTAAPPLQQTPPPPPPDTYSPDPGPAVASGPNVPGIIILTTPGSGRKSKQADPALPAGKVTSPAVPAVPTPISRTGAPGDHKPNRPAPPVNSPSGPAPVKTPEPSRPNRTTAMLLPAGFRGSPLLKGAGSTTAAPLLQAWLDFTPSGSGAGIRQLMDRKVDLAASDLPLTDDQLRPMQIRPLHFPVAVNAVVPIYNLPGAGGELRLTGESLAGIYLGSIRFWDDPRISVSNPGARLPHAGIVAVHRGDAGATSHVFADYLAKISVEWKAAGGANGNVNWAAGLAGKGNDGVAALVKQTQFSIGYVDWSFAAAEGLPSAAVRNRAGQYIHASPGGVTSAAAFAARDLPNDFRASITDAAGHTSYPISSFTYLLIPSRIEDSTRRAAVRELVLWMLQTGQAQVADAGFARLPTEVLEREARQLPLLQ